MGDKAQWTPRACQRPPNPPQESVKIEGINRVRGPRPLHPIRDTLFSTNLHDLGSSFQNLRAEPAPVSHI